MGCPVDGGDGKDQVVFLFGPGHPRQRSVIIEARWISSASRAVSFTTRSGPGDTSARRIRAPATPPMMPAVCNGRFDRSGPTVGHCGAGMNVGLPEPCLPPAVVGTGMGGCTLLHQGIFADAPEVRRRGRNLFRFLPLLASARSTYCLVLVPEPGQVVEALDGGDGVADGMAGRVEVGPVRDGGNVFIPEVPRSVQLGGGSCDFVGGHVDGEAELVQAVRDEVVVHRRGTERRDFVGVAEGGEFAAGRDAFVDAGSG